MFPIIRTLAKRTLAVAPTLKFENIQNVARFRFFQTKNVLSAREIVFYRKLFDKIDTNKDGYLTKEDLRSGFKVFVNYTASEEELNETMESLDSDKDGAVGVDEFLSYIESSKQRTEEEIRTAFETFDRDNDGLINEGELRKALVRLGLISNEAILNIIMLLSDENNDGNLTLEEFRKVFQMKRFLELHSILFH